MKIEANSIQEYLEQLPEERREVLEKLRAAINANLPAGFAEQLNYGMPAWVVPHSVYPDGYHCDTSQPLPFLSIASQKNFVGLYHMGIYANPDLQAWWREEYPKHAKYKLDMGKSCVRLKRMNDIPYELIGELAGKMTAEDWISLYERALKKS